MGDAARTRLIAFECATGVVAALAMAAAVAFTSATPNPAYVLAFGALVVVAEHRPAALASTGTISPSLMIVMASITFFDGDSAVVGAGAVGAFGGIYLDQIRRRRYSGVLFNAGQYALAAQAAALALSLLGGPQPTWGIRTTAAAMVATLAYSVVNVAFVVPQVSLCERTRARVVWAEMRPAVPSYLAFGLLGLLLGALCKELGLAAVILLAVPMAIGRSTFASFLRLREAHEAAIRLFGQVIEAKDPYTAGHTERVAKYSQYIAEELEMPPSRYERLRHSALMHDVGKLAVPNRLLNKPGRLTEEEFAIVRRHNDVCINILGRVDFMREMAVTASDRHGRFERDAGRPRHELVLEAHIVAVADAFDAMTSTRSYRQALDQDVAFEELRRNAGTQFDPECVEALVAAIERRGERYGLGHELDAHRFAVTPPVTGVGSAGLGDFSPTADSP